MFNTVDERVQRHEAILERVRLDREQREQRKAEYERFFLQRRERIAEKARAVACALLGLPLFRIEWKATREFSGQVGDKHLDRIEVSTEQLDEHVCKAVLHEARHLYQFRHWEPWRSRAECEADAEAFALAHAATVLRELGT